MRKFISMLVAAMLMLSVLSGCFIMEPFQQHGMLSDLPEGDPDFTQSAEEVTQPVASGEDESDDDTVLKFTLDQDMIDRYYALEDEAEKIAIAGTDLKAAQSAFDKLDEAREELITQSQIAYVLYCMDQSSQTCKQRYMDCVETVEQMEFSYNEMCRRIYLSGTLLRDDIFADWTQQDIDILLAYNDEIAQLENRNSELIEELRALPEDDWEENMVQLYNEMVRNNNRIAEIYGYDDYYSYAYDVIYKRDYGTHGVVLIRHFVSKYFSSIVPAAIEKFDTAYAKLDSQQKTVLSELSYSPYNELMLNYVQMFIQDMPESSQTAMNKMFDQAVFTSSPNAYSGAFTVMLGDKPFSYFGPDHAVADSVIHELGHFYGISYADQWNQPLDISESQSRGNEWMFNYFLGKCMDSEMYQAYIEYRVTTDLSYILGFVMVDQFEEQVYSHPNAGYLSLEEYDAIMEEVAEDYGGIHMISENIMDIQGYWKSVVMRNPVYCISQAVSAITAINLFTIAQEDEQDAKECYRKLMEELLVGEGFLDNISETGIDGPFRETVYRQIYERYAN